MIFLCPTSNWCNLWATLEALSLLCCCKKTSGLFFTKLLQSWNCLPNTKTYIFLEAFSNRLNKIQLHYFYYQSYNFSLYSRVWNRRTPWNKHSPPLKNFHIRILIHFYINQGIAVIFQFFFFKIFQKWISVPLCLLRSLEYLSNTRYLHTEIEKA